ncbi:sensor histidine kinase [Alloprevotella sp. OH1205_COT-284]|uniref:sensor histidine kinase n=1 Tax=Alloprevotella sp. OH1205_COT-284 TaxID=2491043 RepID=UPI000F5DD5F3|nr:HAMP domain-containing sensor histidine kinase [Alloprevotella sp. OH1205_COT-284]RRD79852.1 sensor histidine kinase [Alloprevotella sp. OH1205_COT-284]
MKKKTIWGIAIVMGISFTVLIFLQVYYFNEIVEMRRTQFDENVKRALYQAVHSLELQETQATIETEIAAGEENHSKQRHSEMEDEGMALPHVYAAPLDSESFVRRPNIRIGETRGYTPRLSEKVRKRFLYQKDLLNEVIYSILYKPLDKPIEQRISRNALDYALKTELQHNGIDLKKMHYHFQVFTVDGREVMRCQDYEESFGDAVFRQEIFANDAPAQMGIIQVRFPEVGYYIFESVKFVLPAIIFTFVLLFVFIYTIYTIFRQKRLTEIKNDFINNMTHEFKTPISSISLASQMLADTALPKNEAMLKQLSSVIIDETKRLRFQVEKVLQMAMFDRDDTTTFKFQEADANGIVEEVVSTFRLKVESTGGSIDSYIEAEDPIILADPMHFTNLIYNLLENALKYRKPEVEVKLLVSTFNESGKLKITIKDNGIGIRKEDLKRIFDRFYRVPTGNVHNVKGVGIGLAYVSSVVRAHNGTIHVDSEYGIGTTFTITIPLLEA